MNDANVQCAASWPCSSDCWSRNARSSGRRSPAKGTGLPGGPDVAEDAAAMFAPCRQGGTRGEIWGGGRRGFLGVRRRLSWGGGGGEGGSAGVLVLQRPWSLANDEKAANPEAPCCPPHSGHGFDAAGNYVAGLGRSRRLGTNGPPTSPRSIRLQGNVLYFVAAALASRRGRLINPEVHAGRKFLLQSGAAGMSKGSLDTDNFNNAADSTSTRRRTRCLSPMAT